MKRNPTSSLHQLSGIPLLMLSYTRQFYTHGTHLVVMMQVVNYEGLSQVYRELLEKFPDIASLEDPFHFDDWGAFAALTEEVGLNTQVRFLSSNEQLATIFN